MDRRCQEMKAQLASSFDVVYRSITIEGKHAYLIFLSSLSDPSLLSDLVEGFVITASNGLAITFYPGAVTTVYDRQEALVNMLSGQCLVLLEESEAYYCIETRSYPSRQNGEPSVEKSVRGAHDGFVENIIFNVGLIRRRIRDPQLCVKIAKKGSKTKTDIAYLYLEKLVDVDVLEDFEHRLRDMQECEIINERNLCEALYGKTWNPYPHVRYSERPDICAIHLLQGYVIVLCDNSPSAMILPTTFF